jgi:dTDP-4-amino-4,6-dideoxygalactose transaminase
MLRLSESSWGQEEISAIQECILSDRFTMGPSVEKFESEFALWNGSKYAVMVNSGSSANLLAAQVLGFQSEFEDGRGTVLVPALSWSTTYFPWVQSGYKLKFVDIDRRSYNVDLVDLESKITSDCVGICIPHILGADAGIEKIMDIAVARGLWVVEDTCESLGGQVQSTTKNLKLGTLGDFGTYSFFRSHHISTMEGGMLVTNNFDQYVLAKSMRAHGWARNISPSPVLGNLESDGWKDQFQFYVPGFNLRPLEISGAIGLEQIKKLDKFLKIRRSNADFFREKLESIADIHLQEQGFGGSWMAFAFTLTGELQESRDQLVSILESAGVETRPIVTGNFVNQPVMKRIASKVEVDHSYPNAEYVDKTGIMIANHGRDLTTEISRVASLLSDFSPALK